MRLARKLAVALVLGISAVMLVDAYFRIRAEETAFEEDSVNDLRVIGRGLASAVEVVWRYDGEERARQFVRELNRRRQEMRVRVVPLSGPEGEAVVRALRPLKIRLLARGREVHIVRRDATGEARRVSYTLLVISGVPPLALEVSESLAAEDEIIRSTERMLLTTAAGMAAVCSLIVVGIGFWFVGRPMRLLSEKARRVGEGDLTGPLILHQRDEIGELASEINAMCDRLAEANRRAATEAEARISALEQLRHADRLKTVGQLASGLAHELGTPLNVVSGHARMIGGDQLSAAEVRASSEVIVEQAERMTAIIRQLLDFSRRRGPDVQVDDLVEIASRTLEMLAPLADRSRVRVELDRTGDEARVAADPNQIRQALANIVVNGFHAMPGGGVLRVAVGLREARPPSDVGGAAATFAVIDVVDQGEGVAPEHLPHVFEPFFTTKDVGEGSGLGLAVAWGIVREHGGWIEVASQPGRGTRFSIFLRPAIEASPGAVAWTS